MSTPEVGTVGTAVAVQEGGNSPAAIFSLLQTAVANGTPVESLERLQALYERVSDRAAAAEFAEAMHRFQEEVGPILGNKTADITSQRTGGKHSYSFASLDHIMRKIRAALQRNGLTVTWDTEIVNPSLIKLICTCRHVNGQFRTAGFPCPTESSAGMSAAQKFGSAEKYAMRHSLIQVLGLVTTDEDIDGADPTTISDDQAADLQALIEQKGLPLNRMLKYFDVNKLSELRLAAYEDSVNIVKNAPERKKKSEDA